MFGHQVKCNLCGCEQTIRYALLYRYRLPYDQIIYSVALPTWCYECNGIRSSERLVATERLAELLVDLEANGLDQSMLQEKASFLRITIDPEQEYIDSIAERRAELSWRMARRSPPRCFDCGGTYHQPFEWTDSGFIHPGCKGTFSSKLHFHGSQSQYIELDSEGNRLPANLD